MEKGVPAQEDAHQEVMEEKQGDTELVCPAGSPLMPLAAQVGPRFKFSPGARQSNPLCPPALLSFVALPIDVPY